MYFCAAPWNHIKLNANGTWKHCCVFDSKSDKPFNGDIKDTSNHQSFKDLRKEMLWGDKPPVGCHDCVKDEATAYSSSLRELLNDTYADRIYDYKRFTEKDGTYNNFKLEYLDIRSSNLCNYKCRFCGIDSSSAWLADTKLVHDYTPPTADNAGVMEANIPWEQLKKDLPYVRFIRLAGGEPLMMPGTYQLLDELIKIKNTKIKISVNTNGSFAKYGKRDIIELLSNFRDVSISLSLDGMNDAHAYLRSGKNDWEKVKNNIDMFVNSTQKQKKSYIRVNFLSSISWLNSMHIVDFLTEYSKKLEGNVNFNFNPIYWPKHMNIGLLTQDQFNKVLDKINKSDLTSQLKNKYSKFLSTLYQATKITSIEEKEQLYKEFIKYNAVLDKSRNQNFAKTFPEWEDFYNKMLKKST